MAPEPAVGEVAVTGFVDEAVGTTVAIDAGAAVHHGCPARRAGTGREQVRAFRDSGLSAGGPAAGAERAARAQPDPAGVVLSETSVRAEIEERFFSFRDVFAALFFFVFGLSIDVGALGSVAWILTAAVIAALVGKLGAGYVAGLVGGLSRRQSFNVGAALVAHGEFTIILAQLASENDRIPGPMQTKLVAFAGLYVLVTATIGIALMKESKVIGRRLFRAPRLALEA
jgi:Sodium/hydrogen exchanger family